MASLTHSPIEYSGTSASDHLQSSSNGVNGIPLRVLGKSRLGVQKMDFTVSAKRKVKKHDYPWPSDPDPNVKGGVLTYLSHFKPLKEKPKPVTLEFEKPLMALEKKIINVRKMAHETGLDFSDQVLSLEEKYHQALKDLYTHLTPIQRVNIARHPNRPTFLDHVLSITDKFVELHGDRAGYDDPAIVTGIGSIGGQRYMFMGHQKGRNTKENIKRNFGMPTPHGYRKALRMMYYADHHGFPIVTFIDTPGAFADLKSEELGQGEAIAFNLRTMFGLKVPVVSIVIGEGGSGGALAIGCANKLLMLENAVFYVASPEACAAILWKTAKASPKAAEKLKITASELCKLKIADGIIPEPLGGAHADPAWTSQQIKIAIVEAMGELMKMDTQELLDHRMLKFRNLGGFQEGIPADPIKKVNMKKKDEPIFQKGMRGKTEYELRDEIGKLKQKVSTAKESSSEPPVTALKEMIKKLKVEVDREYLEAVEAMGLKDRLHTLHEEFVKARTSPNQLIHPGLMDKIEKLKVEFNKKLAEAPNFDNLSYKLDMLKEISKAKELSEKNDKAMALKEEINKKIKKVLNQSNVRKKIEMLKTNIANAGDPDHVMKVKKEIEVELAELLRSLKLEVEVVESETKDLVDQSPLLEYKVEIEELNEEINEEIESAIGSSDLRNKIELLKLEVVKAGKNPDKESMKRIEALKQQIKKKIMEAVSSPSLIDKHEQLKIEIARAMESFRGIDGSLKQAVSFS